MRRNINRQIAEAALRTIDELGWIQNDFRNENGVCLAKAILLTGEMKAETAEFWVYLKNIIEREFPDRSASIFDFNDNPSTTREDVRKVLRIAAGK